MPGHHRHPRLTGLGLFVAAGPAHGSVARLLGWQSHEQDVLSDTTVRSLVRTHGQLIRQAEQTEVATLATRDDLASLNLTVVPQGQP